MNEKAVWSLSACPLPSSTQTLPVSSTMNASEGQTNNKIIKIGGGKGIPLQGRTKKKKNLAPNLLLKYSICSRLENLSPQIGQEKKKNVELHTVTKL